MGIKYDLFCFLRVNPEYGIQQYPISGVAPDMALPNVIGNFFYRRTFMCENITKPTALHFEGIQNAVSVWINDEFLGRHEGYSTPFDVEFPEGVLQNGENTIVLSVSNHRLEGYDGEPVSGLTSREANECTGGITGDVELRVYSCPLRDVALLVSDDCKSVAVKIEAVGESTGDFVFDNDGLDFWSPENPKLYTFEISFGDDSLSRKFGVRRLLADGPHFTLDGNPYYLRGICEHCYFSDKIYPAHDLNYYRSIIKAIKKLGFNFVSFHTYIPEEEYMQAADELEKALGEVKNILILGTEPFVSLPTTYRIALAGRCSGNLATVIADHPVFNDLPHDGFCGWQFNNLMEKGNAICFECDDVPFNPILEVVSTHKFPIKQSALIEFNALNGKLLVCSFNFMDNDPAASWLKAKLISYMNSG